MKVKVSAILRVPSVLVPLLVVLLSKLPPPSSPAENEMPTRPPRYVKRREHALSTVVPPLIFMGGFMPHEARCP